MSHYNILSMLNLTSQFDYIFFIVSSLFILVSFTILFTKLFKKSPFLKLKSKFLSTAFKSIIVMVVIILIAGWIITYRIGKVEEKHLYDDANFTSTLIKKAIENDIKKINTSVESISVNPFIKSALKNTTHETVDKANSVLDIYQKSLQIAIVYVLDTNGLAIASTNRNTPTSLIGNNYSYRPYFVDSKMGKQSHYLGIGVTTGIRGYFSSAPITDSNGKFLGVAVIKDELNDLDTIFKSVPNAFLVDKNNIIFLASNPKYQFRGLFPISDSLKSFLLSTHQYTSTISKSVLESNANLSETILNNQVYRITKVPLIISGWYLTLLTSKSSVYRYRLQGISSTIAFALFILITFSLLALYRVREWADHVFLSEKRFETIFENAPDPITICECGSGRIIATNSLAKLWMPQLENNNSVSIFDLLERDIKDIATNETISNRSALQGLFTLRDKDLVRYLSVSSTNIFFKGNTCFLSFLRDITSIMSVQNTLETNERKYKELVEFLPEAVFETDLSGQLTFTNKRGLEIFEYEQSDLDNGISIFEMILPEQRKIIISVIDQMHNGVLNNYREYTGISKHGKRFPISVYTTAILRKGIPVGICGIATDLTERMKIEHELQQKDKLESLGILAGGIAHDFNNILTSIWSGISLIKISNDQSILQSTTTDIETAIRRGKDLTGRLLTYSKGGAPIKSAVSLTDIVKETASFALTGKPVKCHISSSSDLYPVEVDQVQISQVIQNLLINAVEAMPDGGVVNISLSNLPDDDTRLSALTPAKYIELRVSDTGCGIPKDILSKVFDPFFTTKSTGSGLGLATTFSVIKQHNGRILVESSEGKGTDFYILLPATNEEVTNASDTKSTLPLGKGKILLMDDEATIRTVAKKLLTYLGYSVDIVENGCDAIDFYKNAIQNKSPYDGVILDLTIPDGIGGKETVKLLLQIDPNVKALVSSGYSNDPIMAKYNDYGFKGRITKPFNLFELGIAVGNLLKTP